MLDQYCGVSLYEILNIFLPSMNQKPHLKKAQGEKVIGHRKLIQKLMGVTIQRTLNYDCVNRTPNISHS